MNPRIVIAWIALVAASVTIFWWNMRSGSFFRMMMRHDPYSSATIFSQQMGDLDDNAKKLAPAQGNLGLLFRGYSQLDETDANFAARIFFRFNYALYPQRVDPMIPEQTLVNTGDDLLSPGTQPTREWLKSRNIRGVALFTRLPNGETRVQPIPVTAP